VDWDAPLSPSPRVFRKMVKFFEHVNHSVDNIVSKIQACPSFLLLYSFPCSDIF
jgi:hypothetical protein